MGTVLSSSIRTTVPVEHRSNFMHLYFDIAWFGVLSGSTLSFIAIYMVRIGANAFQIGLFNATPAMITLLLALPTGWWLKNKPLGRSVFWSAALFRFIYLLWIPLPLLFNSQTQIWTLMGFTLLMSIPGTSLAIGFNGLFANTVPPEWRAHVAGGRNAVLAISFILTSLLSGYLLASLPFPLGYQVIFGIGFLGASLSTLHLWFIREEAQDVPRLRTGQTLGDLARPGTIHSRGHVFQSNVGLRFLSRQRHLRLPRLNILKGAFGRIVFVLFLFHLTLYLPQPLFPLYWVDRLHLTDQEISLGNALFYLAVFVVSTQLSRLTRRWSHYQLLVLGAVLLSIYPTVTAMMQDVPQFLINSIIGGAGWSLVAGSVNNYLLENIPAGDRPVHLAWYNLTLHAAILISSLTGPALAQQLGLVTTLLLIGGARLASAITIWRWGQGEQIAP